LPAKRPQDAARICDEGIALDEPAAALAAAAPPLDDEWSRRQRVRSLGRDLRRPGAAAKNMAAGIPHSRIRLDPPHDLYSLLDAQRAASEVAPQVAPTIARPRRGESSQLFAWLAVMAGVLGLVAGCGLLAWSLSTGQMMYWELALGLSLGSQGVLVLGLVLVISRLWRSSRCAANKLHDVHARLGQLQHTADALLGMRAGGAPAFYAELVRGSSPHVLLANLKGQVDQLATRMSRPW
jgi:hypothetical protein